MRGKKKLLIGALIVVFVAGCLSAAGMHFYSKSKSVDNVELIDGVLDTLNELNNEEVTTND